MNLRRVSASEMQLIDQLAINDYGIPGIVLMENAGRGIAEFILRHWDEEDYEDPVVVLAGGGNNGGDGFVVARHLYNHGRDVSVLCLGNVKRLKAEAKINYSILCNMGIPIENCFGNDRPFYYAEKLKGAGLIIDALLGVGLSGEVKDPYGALILALSRPPADIISIDIPSGLNADSGEVMGYAVRAQRTLTLGLPKTGLFQGKGPEYAGAVAVIDIGLPRQLL